MKGTLIHFRILIILGTYRKREIHKVLVCVGNLQIFIESKEHPIQWPRTCLHDPHTSILANFPPNTWSTNGTSLSLSLIGVKASVRLLSGELRDNAPFFRFFALGGGGWRFLMICRDIRINSTAIENDSRLALPYTFHPIDVAVAHAHLVDETETTVEALETAGKTPHSRQDTDRT
jgi:hypothetical protein